MTFRTTSSNKQHSRSEPSTIWRAKMAQTTISLLSNSPEKQEDCPSVLQQQIVEWNHQHSRSSWTAASSRHHHHPSVNANFATLPSTSLLRALHPLFQPPSQNYQSNLLREVTAIYGVMSNTDFIGLRRPLDQKTKQASHCRFFIQSRA